MQDLTTKGWRPARDVYFAQRLEAIALSVAEIWLAGQSLPLAFMRDGERWRAMAVFSPGDGVNRFVDMASGQWRAPYIPALMRGYPFRLDDSDPSALKLWPGCAPEPLADGVKPFLDEAGQPTEEVRRILGHLRQVHAGMDAVHEAVALLDAQDVLIPWVLEEGDGSPLLLGGRQAWVLDAAAFRELGDATVLELRRLDALGWLYAQQHSLHHARRLREAPPSLDQLPLAAEAEPVTTFDDEAMAFLSGMLDDDPSH